MISEQDHRPLSAPQNSHTQNAHKHSRNITAGLHIRAPFPPSHTVIPSTVIHLPGTVKCKGDYYQWRARPPWRSTALPSALQRKWENIANLYSPVRVCVCGGGGGATGFMLCALVMPEAWPAWLSSFQACLPSRNVLTSGGLVRKCFSMHTLAEVPTCGLCMCVCVYGHWCAMMCKCIFSHQ